MALDDTSARQQNTLHSTVFKRHHIVTAREGEALCAAVKLLKTRHLN